MREDAIAYIQNPSEDLQCKAVDIHFKAIEYIKDPSEKVQMAVINKSPYCIGSIKNPTENVQLKAFEKVWEIVYYRSQIDIHGPHSDWFYKEINRLKLIKGPIMNREPLENVWK